MIRAVVTGASGFIGQEVVRHLLKEGLAGAPVRVVAIVRDPSKLAADIRGDVECHTLDLAQASAESIAAACGVRAVVFHLAANASVQSGEAGYQNNIRATERLIAALRIQPPQRLVFVSSIGAVDRLPADPCTSPLDDDAPPNPLTRYGAGKLAGERLVMASGLPFTIVRPTWVYGPAMRADSHLAVLLAMVRRGGIASRINFPGRVSVIHVRDLARGLALAAAQPAALGATMFASDGTPRALGEIFHLMGEVTGHPSGSVRVPGPVVALARTFRRFLPFAAQNLCSDLLCASNARLESIGFHPSTPFRTGITELARATGVSNTATWLVTGGASGIGRALCVQLFARGASVIAVDRDASGLAALSAECPGIETITADLSLDAGRAIVRGRIEDESRQLDGIVNCAGIGARGAVGTVAINAERRLLDVNVVTLAEFTTTALRRFATAASGGMVVNVASSAALQPLPYMAAYAASKAFVLNYSEAAAAEYAATPNVRLVTICPGGTDTAFQGSAGVKRVQGERLMAPHEVARLITRAIDANRSATILVGTRTVAMALMARVLPRTMLVRLWGRLMGALR
jgi:nucleoside-diphosphate-sugar epimerase